VSGTTIGDSNGGVRLEFGNMATQEFGGENGIWFILTGDQRGIRKITEQFCPESITAYP
jgi:hypothetical protein